MQRSDRNYLRNILHLVDEIHADVLKEVLTPMRKLTLTDAEVPDETDEEKEERKNKSILAFLATLGIAIGALIAKYTRPAAVDNYRVFVSEFVQLNEARHNAEALNVSEEEAFTVPEVPKPPSRSAPAPGTSSEQQRLARLPPVVPSNQPSLSGISVNKKAAELTSKHINRSLEIKSMVEENVKLITSIPVEYLDDVRKVITEAILDGTTIRDISKKIVERTGVAKSRADLIARDQTNKISGQLKKDAEIRAGRMYYKWRTVGDSRVRERHTDISEVDVGYGVGIYRWVEHDKDKVPVSKEGTPIWPGQDYQCRCHAINARPILSVPEKPVRTTT